MKSPAFHYEAPSTLEQAARHLRADPEATLVAGGQSLLPLLALRLAHPSRLIDLAGIAGLDGISVADDTVEIGAMVTQRDAERAPLIRERAPLLAEALRHIAHPPIRNRGTIGGSLAHADPAAELPTVVRALDGELIAAGPDGSRVISARDFWVAPFATALAPDEILAGARVPVHAGGWAFQELARRPGDFAVALCAVVLAAEGSRCSAAKIVLGGVGPTPVSIEEAAEVLVGATVDESAARAAAAKASASISPSSDVHGSAEYRRHAAGVLVRRACLEAWARLP